MLFELPEVEELHNSMAGALSTNGRTKVMTTFGETQVLPLQKEESVQNNALTKGHDAIFRTSGINPGLFTGVTKEALDVSLTREEAIA